MPDSTALLSHPADSALIDSVAADTASAKISIVNFTEMKKCHEVDGPRVLHLKNVRLGRVEYAGGIDPEPISPLPGYDSGVMCLLIVIFLIITANCRHYSTFLKTFATDLFSVRRRANVFDESRTMSETRVLFSLVMLVCVCEGILLFSAVSFQGVVAETFPAIGLLTLLSALYYGLQLHSYRLVGYIFSNKTDTMQWIKGFNASQSFLGLVLVVPTLLILFNPGMSVLLLSISVALYATARVIFISKGFRIFYDNYSSLVYFILYLCTLEIIPPVLIYRMALNLTIIY